ncbi:MAG: Transcriptional regulator TrmB [uncultured bacterium]|nr:MAG: Transcriptional regulator TrmB [uncultured bacterium]
MSFSEDLENLGLSENEARVYLAVLELGEPTIGKIEKTANLHRQIIYNAANNLETRGLLSIRELRGKKHFAIENPSALEDYAEIQLRKSRDLVAQLYERINLKRTMDITRMFQGRNAVHQYYINNIRKQPKGSIIYILGVNSERYFEIYNKAESPYQRFEYARDKRKIRLNLLLFGDKEKEIKLNSGRKLIELRILPKLNNGPMDIMIWHNQVGMLLYANDPYILDIIGKEAVEGFKEYFYVFWNLGRQVK